MSSSGFENRGLSILLASLSFSLGVASFAPGAARADILVVAPHPDDDIITAAGVIYRARQNGIVVWVAYMTNGDYYPTGTAWGRERGDEAVAAQALLGVPSDHLLFLGYPDAGLQDLHTASYATTVYVPSFSTQSSMTYARNGSVPYSQIRAGGPVPTIGNNVRADLLYLIEQVAPTDIFVVSTTDMHPDHSATSQFVTEAVVTRRNANSAYNPIIHYALVWDSTAKPLVWPLAPDPTTFFSLPPQLATKGDPYQVGYDWSARESLDVPLVMQRSDWSQNLKALAIDDHDTQGGFSGQRDDGHISSFVHKDEFFFPRRLGGTVLEPDASARGPVPNAGLDQTVSLGASVQLSGAASLAPSGRSLTYSWRQQDGPSVPLSGSGTATPSFTVPASASGATLTFELRINDGLATSIADAVSVRVGGTPPPDAGTPPPVDAGTPPPVDAGTPPPVDSGTLDAGTPPVDAGTPPVDSGSRLDGAASSDSATPGADSGSTQIDAGAQLADAGTTVDSGFGVDAGAAADAGIRLDAGAALLDAGAPPDLGFGGGISAWPGDTDFDQDVGDIVAEGGSAVPNANKGSGCGIAADSGDAPLSVLTIALGLCASRLRRRHASRRS